MVGAGWAARGHACDARRLFFGQVQEVIVIFGTQKKEPSCRQKQSVWRKPHVRNCRRSGMSDGSGGLEEFRRQFPIREIVREKAISR